MPRRLVLLTLPLLGCAAEPSAPATPTVYAFESRFVPGASSVSYSGQTLRHLLIEDLHRYLGDLTADLDAGRLTPTAPADLVEAFDYYLAFDSDIAGSDSPRLVTTPPLAQSTYDEVAQHKPLVDKIAGNDASTDHVDFDAGGFAGWSDPAIAAHGGAITSPEGLVRAFLATLARQAFDRLDGLIPTGADGTALPVHVTATGLDLRELTQKFLTGAIAFHQAADDYLDDATPGKGLLSANLAPTGDTPYTELEHAWDEGFGYFGAAIDYLAYTDLELAGKGGRESHAKGYFDRDGDGLINVLNEYNFGHALNCAKRDLGARPGGETDLSGDAMTAFLEGRAIIHAAAGRALTDTEFVALRDARDRALTAWETAIAASALHYINETLAHMTRFGTPDYTFEAHAKAWSELKGFALSLQFNPRSPLPDAAFTALHTHIGDRPVLPTADARTIDAYREALREARALLATHYDIAPGNIGDLNGANGW
jgi:hypothetical protein